MCSYPEGNRRGPGYQHRILYVPHSFPSRNVCQEEDEIQQRPNQIEALYRDEKIIHGNPARWYDILPHQSRCVATQWRRGPSRSGVDQLVTGAQKRRPSRGFCPPESTSNQNKYLRHHTATRQMAARSFLSQNLLFSTPLFVGTGLQNLVMSVLPFLFGLAPTRDLSRDLLREGFRLIGPLPSRETALFFSPISGSLEDARAWMCA